MFIQHLRYDLRGGDSQAVGGEGLDGLEDLDGLAVLGILHGQLSSPDINGGGGGR